MTINQFKKYLLAKNKNTLVELYVQKCADVELYVQKCAELKNDIKMLTNNYVNLLLLDRDK